MSHLDVVLYPPDLHCMDWNVLQKGYLQQSHKGTVATAFFFNSKDQRCARNQCCYCWIKLLKLFVNCTLKIKIKYKY